MGAGTALSPLLTARFIQKNQAALRQRISTAQTDKETQRAWETQAKPAA